jgi:hypothetical protein
MQRWASRAAAGLTVAHGALSMAMAPKLYPRLSPEMLAFAQHGFAFVFIALLNLLAFETPRRPPGARAAVHACNAALLAFYLLWCALKPEPPNYVGAGLLFALTLLGAIGERRPAAEASRAR